MEEDESKKFNKVLALLKTWKKKSGAIERIDGKSVRSLSLRKDIPFVFLPSQTTKSIYYSIFVDQILDLGHRSGGCVYLAIEAVMTMALTPSPSGWREGMAMAISDQTEQNLFERFVDNMVTKRGCVSAGDGRRRQVSHPRHIKKSKVMKSLQNILRLIDSANKSEETEILVQSFAKSPEQGGVAMTGELIAQEMVQVLAAVGIITNQELIGSATVAGGTKTSIRLASMGIDSPEM